MERVSNCINCGAVMEYSKQDYGNMYKCPYCGTEHHIDLLGRIEDDSPLSGFNIKEMNPKTYKMLNNFIMLKDKEKDEVLWYSEAVRKKDLN